MKNFFIYLFAIFIVVISCFGVFVETKYSTNNNNFENRFITEQEYSAGLNNYCHVIIDQETKVQYLVLRTKQGTGITVLVNEQGKPLLYEGD